MFSLQRPSPQAKCASSISSSYVPGAWLAKSAEAVWSASAVGQTGGGPGVWAGSWGDGAAVWGVSGREGGAKERTSGGTGPGGGGAPPTRPLFLADRGGPGGPGGEL